jgi:hypothetical protein
MNKGRRLFLGMLAVFLAMVTVPHAQAGGGRPKVIFRIHIETTRGLPGDQSLSVALVNPPMEIPVGRFAELSERNLAGAIPYEGRPGAVLVTFDDQGSRRLATLTEANNGKRLVVLLNGRVVFSPMIDAPLPNGQIVIPSGVAPEEMAMMVAEGKKNRRR